MVQHLPQESESSIENAFRFKQKGVIEWKVDGQAGDPLNFELPTYVQLRLEILISLEVWLTKNMIGCLVKLKLVF